MLLQKSNTEVCHALLQFPDKQSSLVVLRFPTQKSPLAPCGSASSQSMSERLITKYDTQQVHEINDM
jgi:hypothetical protein